MMKTFEMYVVVIAFLFLGAGIGFSSARSLYTEHIDFYRTYMQGIELCEKETKSTCTLMVVNVGDLKMKSESVDEIPIKE